MLTLWLIKLLIHSCFFVNAGELKSINEQNLCKNTQFPIWI